jgi:hypothetical protein
MYHHEQEVICDKIMNTIAEELNGRKYIPVNLDKYNDFIAEIEPDIKKYFAISEWPVYFYKDKTKNINLGIIKSTFKASNKKVTKGWIVNEANILDLYWIDEY